MQLIFERAQRTAGMISSKQVFATTVRAEISDAEREAINKYKLADEVLFADTDKLGDVDPNSFFSVLKGAIKAATIGKLVVRDLVNGKTFENEDIGGMLATEEKIKTAARNFQAYLNAAATFGGREVIDLNE